MKKVLFVGLLLLIPSLVFGDVINIGEEQVPFKGLQRNPKADKIQNGAHVIFDNVYIKDGNIQSVKGRDRLNSTANADTTVNMFCYYENAAGTTKKLVVKESDEVVTYAVDGTTRTSIVGSLTNEKATCTQVGDTLYFTSATDGLYKWTGSGSATAVGSVSAPSSVDFSATTGDGGLTPGLPIAVTPSLVSDSTCALTPDTTATGCICLANLSVNNCSGSDAGGSGVTSDDGTLEQSGTTTTYQYKVAKYSTVWGIESEPSSADSAVLDGDTTFTWSGTNCTPCDSGSPYDTYGEYCCSGINYVTSGQETRTSGTLATAPSAPFDSYRVYRTVAGGSEYFLVGVQTTGAFTDGKPDVALGVTLDTSIDTTSPPSYKYIMAYKGTLFVAEDTSIRFTRLPVETISGADTYWLQTDEIKLGSEEGTITGLYASSTSLLIFTTKSIYEITGFGYNSFRLSQILKGIGAVSNEAIEVDEQGDIIFFAGTEGVFKLRTFAQPRDELTGTEINTPRVSLVRLSSPVLENVFKGEDNAVILSSTEFSSSHSYYDNTNSFYFLYVGDDCLLFDNKNAQWSHLPGTQMLNSLYRKSSSELGQGVILDNKGFIYNNWTGYENGIHSGTVTGNPTSSGNTTLTDSTATFNTTNDGLKGLWIFVDNENGEWRQIASNTSTQITVTTAWTVNPVVSDDYYIAYIIPNWKTKQYQLAKTPREANVSKFWLMHNKSTATQDLEFYTYENKSSTPSRQLSGVINLSTNFIDKIGSMLRSSWVQWEFRSFIYNTTNSNDSSVDILGYAIEYTDEEMR